MVQVVEEHEGEDMFLLFGAWRLSRLAAEALIQDYEQTYLNFCSSYHMWPLQDVGAGNIYEASE